MELPQHQRITGSGAKGKAKGVSPVVFLGGSSGWFRHLLRAAAAASSHERRDRDRRGNQVRDRHGACQVSTIPHQPTAARPRARQSRPSELVAQIDEYKKLRETLRSLDTQEDRLNDAAVRSKDASYLADIGAGVAAPTKLASQLLCSADQPRSKSLHHQETHLARNVSSSLASLRSDHILTRTCPLMLTRKRDRAIDKLAQIEAHIHLKQSIFVVDVRSKLQTACGVRERVWSAFPQPCPRTLSRISTWVRPRGFSLLRVTGLLARSSRHVELLFVAINNGDRQSIKALKTVQTLVLSTRDVRRGRPKRGKLTDVFAGLERCRKAVMVDEEEAGTGGCKGGSVGQTAAQERSFERKRCVRKRESKSRKGRPAGVTSVEVRKCKTRFRTARTSGRPRAESRNIATDRHWTECGERQRDRAPCEPD
ncbi:hypothetical protein L1887_58910 [Cichorium endivia]|nr:hypothetical protein L1887_58910 [Cichorium endivia]